MIITVSCPDGKGTAEWLVLDLQGSVELAKAVESESFGGILLGHIITPEEPAEAGSKVTLQIGNHRCSGTLEDLAKPLVVVGKAPGAGAAAAAEAAADDEAAAGDDGSAGVAYTARAVIRRKFVFRDRPQPIVGVSVSR